MVDIIGFEELWLFVNTPLCMRFYNWAFYRMALIPYDRELK